MGQFVSKREFHAACRAVIKLCPDQYAKAYARAGLSMINDEEVKVQCLYILNNTSSWRGEEARANKAVLKAYSKM